MSSRKSIRIYQDLWNKLSKSAFGDPPTSKVPSLNDMSSFFRLLQNRIHRIRNKSSWKVRLQTVQKCTFDSIDNISVFCVSRVHWLQSNFMKSRFQQIVGQSSKSTKGFFYAMGQHAHSGSRKPMGIFFAAAFFNWDKENIDDSEVGEYVFHSAYCAKMIQLVAICIYFKTRHVFIQLE